MQRFFHSLGIKHRLIVSYTIVITVYVVAMPAIAIVLGDLLDRILNLPSSVVPPPYNYVIAIPIITLCWALIIWTSRSIVIIGKGHPAEIFKVEVSPVTQHLVVVGPYHRIRNPMATANITYMFIGLGFLTNSLSMMLFYPVALFIAFLYFKVFEEPAMLERFGSEYAEYRVKTPMFFPSFSRAKR